MLGMPPDETLSGKGVLYTQCRSAGAKLLGNHNYPTGAAMPLASSAGTVNDL